MDAKAKAIEALEEAGFAPWFDEDSLIRKYPNGTSYATVGSTQTSVTLNVPHKDVPFLFPPSLSPKEKQRLEEIRKLFDGGSYAYDLEGLCDFRYLLSLVDRLTGGA